LDIWFNKYLKLTVHNIPSLVPIFEFSRTRNQGPGRIQQAKKRNRSDKKFWSGGRNRYLVSCQIFKNATCFILPNQQQPKQNTMLKHPSNHLQQHIKSPKTKPKHNQKQPPTKKQNLPYLYPTLSIMCYPCMSVFGCWISLAGAG